MFGFSLAKLLFTVAVVVGVWMAFRHVGRFLAAREQRAAVGRRRNATRPAATKSGSDPADSPADSMDLIPCPQCGTYILRGATCACGYKDRN